MFQTSKVLLSYCFTNKIGYHAKLINATQTNFLSFIISYCSSYIFVVITNNPNVSERLMFALLVYNTSMSFSGPYLRLSSTPAAFVITTVFDWFLA